MLYGGDMEDVDIVKELESADIVILEGSMGTLGEFPFGVADYYQDNFSKTLRRNFKDMVDFKREKSFFLKAYKQ